ncbi:MAG TPA: hypothetical protein VJY41_15550 [Prolixibacteraceae bacterium]|nr:hypothetical protein [Prolixibacteraceae bacterium]
MKHFPVVFLGFILLCANILSAQDISQLSKQQAVSIRGSLSTTANIYGISGKTSTRDPFNYMLSGNVDLSVYGVSLPFSFMYSGQNIAYTQPFNRFGISPHYKWIKTHFGYRSMNFSSYTLAGHSFLGAGVELNPGKFRLAGVYGRFKQKTIPNTANPIDTLYAPTRKGYSVKLGFGSNENFFDLIFLQISDDSLSVDLSQGNSAMKLPQSNTVLGTHFRFKLAKSLVWETEGALSLLTKNTGDQLISDIDIALIQQLSGALNLNASSEYATAWNSSLMYSAKLYSLGLQYRRISPNYQSFGAYYFNTDIENLTINGKFSAFKRKLNVNGNVGLQRDNLRGNKASQSVRVISMANANYNTGKVFSINGSFSNYSINQQAGRLPLNDTIKLYQTNRSINLMPMLTFTKAELQQVVQLNAMFTDMIDHNLLSTNNSNVNTRMLMLNYFVNHTKLEASLMTGINYTSMTSAVYNQTLYGFTADVSKSFLKSKLNPGLSFSVNRSELGGETGWVNTLSAMLTYKPHKKHSFKMNVTYIMNNYPGSSIAVSYRETKALFSYVYRI